MVAGCGDAAGRGALLSEAQWGCRGRTSTWWTARRGLRKALHYQPGNGLLEVLGHSQISITLNTYTHVSAGLSRDFDCGVRRRAVSRGAASPPHLGTRD